MNYSKSSSGAKYTFKLRRSFNDQFFENFLILVFLLTGILLLLLSVLSTNVEGRTMALLNGSVITLVTAVLLRRRLKDTTIIVDLSDYSLSFGKHNFLRDENDKLIIKKEVKFTSNTYQYGSKGWDNVTTGGHTRTKWELAFARGGEEYRIVSLSSSTALHMIAMAHDIARILEISVYDGDIKKLTRYPLKEQDSSSSPEDATKILKEVYTTSEIDDRLLLEQGPNYWQPGIIPSFIGFLALGGMGLGFIFLPSRSLSFAPLAVRVMIYIFMMGGVIMLVLGVIVLNYDGSGGYYLLDKKYIQHFQTGRFFALPVSRKFATTSIRRVSVTDLADKFFVELASDNKNFIIQIPLDKESANRAKDALISYYQVRQMI